MTMRQQTATTAIASRALVIVLFGMGFIASDRATAKEPEAAKSDTGAANARIGKGRAELIRSRSASDPAEKEQLQKKARGFFIEAREIFQADHDRHKKAYEKFDKFIPKTAKEQYEAREAAYRNYIQAQLQLAVTTYDEARTWDNGTPENKRLLTDAANAFEAIHNRYRQQIAGLYARMYQGRCFDELGDVTKALGFYNELLEHGGGKPSEPLKVLQDTARKFRLSCLNRDERKDHQLVVQESREWIEENESIAETPNGLGIQWELARALELLARKVGTDVAEKSRLLQEALSTAQTINKHPGEYKEASSEMIQRLTAELKLE